MCQQIGFVEIVRVVDFGFMMFRTEVTVGKLLAPIPCFTVTIYGDLLANETGVEPARKDRKRIGKRKIMMTISKLGM
ncbi:hypothetical protein EMCG_07738 [[Emmonsia] crescens]|uniref:Uncharacterized protein n=1 Tax=[Emmonsia] crescens TaxID=73230 RepID=A0A0G2I7R2_9EURO|nr:hypothetical protein EMCG_07738 [Emmonsia crescens UAMH 3008]